MICSILCNNNILFFKELSWKRRRKGGSFQEDEYDNATSNLSNWLKRTQTLLDEPLEVEEQAALYEDIMSEIDSQKSQLDFASKFITNSESKLYYIIRLIFHGLIFYLYFR